MNKIYNEDKYLKEGNLDQFYVQRVSFEAYNKIFEKFGDELNYEYFDFIDRTSEFIKGFDINDDPILTALLIKTLLYNGAFSITNKFNYSMNPKYEPHKSGISVISGKGCCRNISDFFEDLESKLGQFVMQYNCNMNLSGEKFKRAINRPVNHVINIISDENGNKIGFDVTNNYFLKFADAYNMKSFRRMNGSDLIYKPYCDYIEGLVDSIDDIARNLILFEEESKKVLPITTGYLIDKSIDAEDIYNQNLSFVEDFKYETKKQKERILSLQRELYKKH